MVLFEIVGDNLTRCKEERDHEKKRRRHTKCLRRPETPTTRDCVAEETYLDVNLEASRNEPLGVQCYETICDRIATSLLTKGLWRTAGLHHSELFDGIALARKSLNTPTKSFS